MTLYELLNNIGHLCDTHDIEIEITEWALYITKFFVHDSKVCKFTQSYAYEIFKYCDIDDCVLEFEKALEKELSKKR